MIGKRDGVKEISKLMDEQGKFILLSSQENCNVCRFVPFGRIIGIL